MTAVGGAEDTVAQTYAERVLALARATARLGFDPYADIDWDAPENALDWNDPRWQLDSAIAPLAATDWYRRQPLRRRVDMGRWVTANTLKVTLQFEMLLIRGVVHYADSLPNGAMAFRYLLDELADECHHIQMFQEFVNRSGSDVPGMRRCSRIFGPIMAFIGGYANIFLFIAVLCGEQPLHFQQTLQHRSSFAVLPLLNTITSIHLAEEARHISFAGVHLAERIRGVGRFRRALYAIAFPLLLRWLIGEMITPPRAFVRQFGVPRRVFRAAYWRSGRSGQMLAESAADVRHVAENLGLRPAWAKWIWRTLGIDGRVPRYRGEPDRSAPITETGRNSRKQRGRRCGSADYGGASSKSSACRSAHSCRRGSWPAYRPARDRAHNIVGNQWIVRPWLLILAAVYVSDRLWWC